MSLVLDSSVALAWALPDESNSTLDPLLDRLITENMMVPPIWPLEMGDVLLVAVRRGRLTAQDMTLLVQEFRATIRKRCVNTTRMHTRRAGMFRRRHGGKRFLVAIDLSNSWDCSVCGDRRFRDPVFVAVDVVR